jgi:acid phosphatase family membrane protein YuiD
MRTLNGFNERNRYSAKWTDLGNPVWLLPAAAPFVLVWLLLAGGLLIVRTVAGATHPLERGQIVIAAFAVACVAWLARRLSTLKGERRIGFPWASMLPVVATSVALLFWGLALSHGVDSSAAAAFFWLVIVSEEALGWRRQFRSSWRASTGGGLAEGQTTTNRVVQEFTRLVTAEGEDIIRGSVAVQVVSGCRMAAGHVAFCPPFAERPRFEIRPHAQQDAALKVSQLYPHGARVEVKLPQPAKTDTTVAVHFVARAPHTPVHFS